MSKDLNLPDGLTKVRSLVDHDMVYACAGDLAMAIETMSYEELDPDAQEALQRMARRIFNLARNG